MTPKSHHLVLIAASLLGSSLLAQQVRVVAPIAGAVVPAAGEEDEDDVGVNVEMLENPNLDRYLRKAQDFLSREEYDSAIRVLQDVIEGRTSVEIDAAVGAEPQQKPEDGGEAGTAAAPEKQPEARPTTTGSKPALGPEHPAAKGSKPGGSGNSVQTLDPSQAVFSPDGRIYRPVRRLCQELLATMPGNGLALYQTQYEIAAKDLLDDAIATGTTAALERVANRYFVTLAAGRAMVMLADRLMYEGRYRAAVQVLHDLIEVYPATNRKQLGISEVWCRFKIALCMRLAGETQTAREAAKDLASRFPDESLRITGELQPIKTLADSPPFASNSTDLAVADHNAVDATARWLRPGLQRLVPLWQVRFTDPTPYKQTPRRNNENGAIFRMDGQETNAAPYAFRYGVGTRVSFRGSGYPTDRAVFLDHNRLEVADAFSGLLEQQGDGSDDPGKPKDNQPRARVPVYDWANMRVIEDEQRYYVVQVYEGRSLNNLNPLKENTLVAYDKATMQPVWSSTKWQEGEDGLADVTFLSAVTVYGERLLVPVLRRGAYAMQCLDRVTGRPLWRTPVHMGGSPFFKAPGTPIQVQGGVAYQLTNAGVLAAVDAFAGDLKWLRKYERRHPLRQFAKKRKSSGRTNPRQYGMTFTETEMPSFLPSELICRDGLIIAAPCDSFVLMCLDGASGQIVWLLDQSCGYADFGNMQYVVGANRQQLFVATKTDLVCIGLRSGVRLWSRSLPSNSGLTDDWRGRGVVLENAVLMPNGREVLAYDAGGKDEPQRIDLPPFAVGPEPTVGACNLTVSGPWLGVAYEGAIEVYSSAPALRDLAAESADPMQSAAYLVQAGDTDAAIDVLDRWLAKADLSPERQAQATARMLNLARERALAIAPKDPAAALALLDRVRTHIVDRTVRMDWHVARLDLYKETHDLNAYEDEQQRLYRFMEGKN